MKRNESGIGPWLSTLKDITVNLFTRDTKLGELCPSLYDRTDEESRKQTRREIATLTATLTQLVRKLNQQEEGKGFGFHQVLNRRPTETESLILALLVSARLDPRVNRDLTTIQDAVGIISCRRPEEAVEARTLFRGDGSVNPLVTLSSGFGVALDERFCRIKERTLNQILGLAPDPVNELVAEMVEVRR